MWISLGVTALFVIAELVLGAKARSLALMSDAGHNASDALALGLAAYAIAVAKKPASQVKTFGYHRVAILTALANASALVVIAVGILAEAIYTFSHPHQVQGGLMAGVAVVAVIMNTVIAVALSGGSKQSLNVRAAYVHMAGDALSSAAVVVAGLVVKATGWTLADPLVSVLIALFILRSSWDIIGDATNVLMEGTPKDLNVDEVVAAMRSVECVHDVHDLHVWTVGDGIRFLSCHVVLPEGSTLEGSCKTISELNAMLLHDYRIGHATIQTEVQGIDCDHDHRDAPYCKVETYEAHDHTHGAACSHAH
jgi:cobalt-zinc-cadmium efflux system protein